MLVTRNGDHEPVRPVDRISSFKRIVGQDDPRYRSDESRSQQALSDETPSTAVATVPNAVAAPVFSSLYLAQHIAQEIQGESRLSKAEGEASVAAYSAADERGTIFYGLEIPVDFSV